MSLRLTAQGPLPPAEVWRRYREYAAWPGWSPHLRRVEVDGTHLTPGARGRVFGPPGVSARFEILEVDDDSRTWSWKVTKGPVAVELEHGVQVHDDGTRTWLVLHGPLPLLLAYAPVARLALHRLVSKA